MEIVAQNSPKSVKSLRALICVCSDHLKHVMSAETRKKRSVFNFSFVNQI